MTKTNVMKEYSSNKELPRYNLFNENKEKLKEFSECLPEETELPRVEEAGGLFGWFDYKVTGSDLNYLTDKIQTKMIEQNKTVVKIIQEFNTIYDTFSALDGEYIQGILTSLRATEEVNKKALKAIEGVKVNQDEIKQIINQQKQVIQVLKNFKDRIDKIEHLTEIDKIFDDVCIMEGNTKSIETKIKSIEWVIDKLKREQTNQFQTTNKLISKQNESTLKIKVLSEKNKKNIDMLHKDMSNYKESVNKLNLFTKDSIDILSKKQEENIYKFNEKVETIEDKIEKNKIGLENFIEKNYIEMDKQINKIEQIILEGNKNVSKIKVISEKNSKNIDILYKDIDNQEGNLNNLELFTKDNIEILSKKQEENIYKFNEKVEIIEDKIEKNKIGFEKFVEKNHIEMDKQSNRFEKIEQIILEGNRNISKIKSISEENSKNINILYKDIDNQESNLNNLELFTKDNIEMLSKKQDDNIDEFNKKLQIIDDDIENNNINVENSIQELRIKMDKQKENICTYIESELSSLKDNLSEMDILTKGLTKSLKITQIALFISIFIICIFITLIIRGVI